MPDFWQFPTVSMGLGPDDGHLPGALPQISARPRAGRHRRAQGLGVPGRRRDATSPRAWAPSRWPAARSSTIWSSSSTATCSGSTGRCAATARSSRSWKAIFRGAGWNVIKVLWGSGWDPLIARDTNGILLRRMEECVDGEYQDFKSQERRLRPRALLRQVSRAEGDGRRHDRRRDLAPDPRRPRPATRSMRPITRRSSTKGQPTVILAKTVKGYGMGEAGEGQNITHQQKKMGEAHLREFRDRFGLPLTDEQITEMPYIKFEEGSPELEVHPRAAQGAGRLPAAAPAQERRSRSRCPSSRPSTPQLEATDGRTISHHHGVRAHPQHAAARQEDRQARRADRARRIAHLRHGGDVPPVRHLQPGGPALPAAGCRPADVLQGGQDRPDPPGGDQRGRRHVVVDRRRRRRTAPTTCR